MSEQGEQIQQTDEIDDIGGDVAAALSELRGGEAPQQTQITLDRSEARPRDEAGRFAKEEKKRETLTLPEKKAEGVQADPAAQLGVTPPAQAAPTPAAPEPAKPAIDYPKTFKGAFRDHWGAVHPDLQAEIARRDKETFDLISRHDEARNFGAKLQEIAQPYLAQIQMENSDIPKAFQDYLQTAYALRMASPMQRAQLLHQVAQKYNVDLSLPHQQGASDPRVAQLEQQLHEMRMQMQGQTQQRQQQEQQGLLSEIDRFASEPGHEHFPTVRRMMGALMDAGDAPDMKTAYEMACHAHPEIRASLLAAQQKAAEEKRIAEQKALSERARSAAVSVTGAPGSSRPLNGAGSRGSVEDDVRAALAEVSGRV